MKGFKKFYYPIALVVIALLVIYSFVNSAVGIASSPISAEGVKAYAQAVAESGVHDIFDDTDASAVSGRKEVVQAIGKAVLDTMNEHYESYKDSSGTTKSMTSVGTSGLSSKSLLSGLPKPTGEEDEDINARVLELVPTFYSYAVAISADDLKSRIPVENQKGLAANQRVQNLVLYIPGTDTIEAVNVDKLTGVMTVDETKLGDVAIISAHYDTAVGNKSYVNNGVAVGSLLALFDYIMDNDVKFKNDLVFLFTDGAYASACGANAFMYASGYDSLFSDARERVKVATSFDCVSDSSVLLMTGSTADGADMLSQYTKISGFAHASSLVGDINLTENKGDFAAFSSIPALNFINAGNGVLGDSVDGIKNNTVNQYTSMMYNVAKAFGNHSDLAAISTANSSAILSYLDISIRYADYVAYILAGLLVLMLAGVIVLAVVKKTNCVKKLGFGALVSLVSVVATVISLALVYLVVAFSLALIGSVSLYSIFSIYTNSLFGFIVAFVLGVLFQIVYSHLFAKVFKVDSENTTGGNAGLLTVGAIVLSFVCPQYAYILGPVAFITLADVLVTALLKLKSEEVSAKYKSLNVGVIGACLMLPLIISEVAILSLFTKVVLLPLFMGLICLYLQSIIPGAGNIVEYFKSTAKKEKDAEAPVQPANAKKAKSPKTISGKTFAVIAVAVVAIAYVVSVVVGSFLPIYKQSKFKGSEEIYNNAFVYEYVNDNGTVKQQLVVKDMDLYSEIQSALGGFTYNGEAYAVSTFIEDKHLLVPANDAKAPYLAHNTNKNLLKFNYNFSQKDVDFKVDGRIEIKIKTVSGGKVDKVNVVPNHNNYSSTTSLSTCYSVAADENGYVEISVPADYGTALAIEVFATANTASDTNVKIDVEVKEYIECGILNSMRSCISNLGNYDETIKKLQKEFSNSSMRNELNFNYVYTYKSVDTIVGSVESVENN